MDNSCYNWPLIMLSKVKDPELAESADDSTCINPAEGVLHMPSS